MRSRSHQDRSPVPNRRAAIVLAVVLGFGGGIAVRKLAAYYGYTAPAWNFAWPNRLNGTEGTEPEGTTQPAAPLGLTQFQLVQKLVDAIAGRSSGEDIYESIPRQQLDGLSYEEFQQYIDVLAGILVNQPTSFVPVALSERDQQITSMIQNGDSWRELAEQSFFYWLETARTPETGERFGIAIQARGDQQPYLAREWITHSVELYKYTQIYLQAIHDNNASLVASMLYCGIADDEVRQLKAGEILRRQMAYPTLNTMGARVRQLRADSLVLDRFTLGSSINSTSTSARMEIVAVSPGSYVIHDGMPSVPDPELTELWTPYRYERELQIADEEEEATELTEPTEEDGRKAIPSSAEKEGRKPGNLLPQSVPTIFAPSEIWRRVEREQPERIFALGDTVDAAQIRDDVGPLIGAQAIYDRETLALMPTSATTTLPETTEFFESITPDLPTDSETTALPYTPDPRYLVLRFDALSLVLDNFHFRAGDDWDGTVVAFSLLDDSVILGDPDGESSFTTSSSLRDWMLRYPFSDQSQHRLTSADGEWLVEAVVGVDFSQMGNVDGQMPLRLLRVVRSADEKAGVLENLEPIQLYTITDNIEITESETQPETEIQPEVDWRPAAPDRWMPGPGGTDKKPCGTRVQQGFPYGADGRDRIHNLLIRSQTLYPVELRPRGDNTMHFRSVLATCQVSF